MQVTDLRQIGTSLGLERLARLCDQPGTDHGTWSPLHKTSLAVLEMNQRSFPEAIAATGCSWCSSTLCAQLLHCVCDVRLQAKLPLRRPVNGSLRWTLLRQTLRSPDRDGPDTELLCDPPQWAPQGNSRQTSKQHNMWLKNKGLGLRRWSLVPFI